MGLSISALSQWESFDFAGGRLCRGHLYICKKEIIIDIWTTLCSSGAILFSAYNTPITVYSYTGAPIRRALHPTAAGRTGEQPPTGPAHWQGTARGLTLQRTNSKKEERPHGIEQKTSCC